MKKKLIIGLFIVLVFAGLLFLLISKNKTVVNPQPIVLKSITEKIDLKKLEPDMRLIWLSDENGKNLRPVLIRIGITDGQYTEIKEIIFGEIKEGDFVVTGKITAGSQSTSSSQDINRIFRSLR